jgi:hypothetical protein
MLDKPTDGTKLPASINPSIIAKNFFVKPVFLFMALLLLPTIIL